VEEQDTMTHDKAVQQQRDKKLVQYTASLDRMAELVDFAAVAAAVDGACPRPDRSSKGGRPPYPTALMVRVLFLQALYNLSDEECEHQLLDRRSFQRFCSLADELSVPDARTIWLFKQRLASSGIGAKAIFEAVQQQLQAHGYLPRGGQIVDATIVRAPIQHLDKDEKAQVDEGKVPKDWSLKKLRHKDLQARWTKKYSRSFFGYKLHANVDVRCKLIRRLKVTPANVDDGQTMVQVLDEANTAARLYGDRGYDHEANRRVLAARGWRDGIARKAAAGRELGPRAQARNKAINRRRARVEHVFGQLHHFGRKVVRAVGLARNELAIVLKCVVYNARRLVWLKANAESA
jgi:IS5 family transposase